MHRTAIAAAVILGLGPALVSAAEGRAGDPGARAPGDPGPRAAGDPGPRAKAAKRPCTKGACARRKARAQLADRVLIRFTETGSIGTPSSLDQRLHLCRSGRFVFDVVSSIEGLDPNHTRTEGAWRVTSARYSRDGRRARARVRGTPDGGGAPLTVTITANGSVVRVDGALVAVQASDLC